MKKTRISSMETFLFDLDGCIYYGDVPAQGASQLLDVLRADGKRCMFLTNNSTQTAQEVADKMKGMGLTASPDDIITVTDYAGFHIKAKYGAVRIKAAGSNGLKAALQSYGHELVSDDHPDPVSFVIIGRDTSFNYAKMQWIAMEAGRGARIIGTNADGYHLGSQGEKVPETGALTAAVQVLTGELIEHLGKPAPYLYQYAIERYGINPDTCVMVGDNLLTDIAGGVQAGIHTVWLSGDYKRTEVSAQQPTIQPDYDLQHIADSLEHYLKCKNESHQSNKNNNKR